MKKEWIFGFHAVESAIKSGVAHHVNVDAARMDKRMQMILSMAMESGVKHTKVTNKDIEAMIGLNQRHQGIIAEITVKEALNDADLYHLLDELTHPPLLLILDNVTDPHNVGACLRSAEAFGVDAVIAPESKACGLTPVVRKVSSGSSERVPFVQVVNLARCLDKLKSRGIWISGLDGMAKGTILNTDFSGPMGIIMGAEGEGLRRLTRERCDFLIKIPMTGEIESLNVSVAAGVVLYAAHAQRSQ